MAVETPVSPTFKAAGDKHHVGLKSRALIGVHDNPLVNWRIHALSDAICAILPRGNRLEGLEIGCADGILAASIAAARPEITMIGVDEREQAGALVPVLKFDGVKLPLEDKSIDFAILNDVLHRCSSPRAVLKEAARVSRKFVIVKDRVYESMIDKALLRCAQWLGSAHAKNKAPCKYFSRQEWQTMFAELGLKPEALNNNIELLPAPFGLIFGSKLQFVARLVTEKRPAGVERWLKMSKISQQLRLISPMR